MDYQPEIRLSSACYIATVGCATVAIACASYGIVAGRDWAIVVGGFTFFIALLVDFS